MYDLIDEKNQTSERKRLESWGGARLSTESSWRQVVGIVLTLFAVFLLLGAALLRLF